MASVNSIIVVKISQFEAIAEQFGKLFQQQYFTNLEHQMSPISTNATQYFASRLAAKTAVLEILNLKENLHLLWHDIEIQQLSRGEPTIVLYAKCQELAMEQGIERWLLSISHTPCYVAASAIALYDH